MAINLIAQAYGTKPSFANQSGVSASSETRQTMVAKPNVVPNNQFTTEFINDVTKEMILYPLEHPANLSPELGPNIMTTLCSIYKVAKERAAYDRTNGVPVLEGLKNIQDTQSGKTLLGILEQILCDQNEIVDPSQSINLKPGSNTIVDGVVNQTIDASEDVLKDIQKKVFNGELGTALNYLKKTFDLDSSTSTFAQIFRKVEDLLGLGSKAASGIEAATVGKVTAGAGSLLGTGAEAGSLLGKLGGTLGKFAGPVGAAYSVFDLVNNFGNGKVGSSALSGATAGGYIGSLIAPGVGTAIGIGVGGLGGAISSLFGKKKKNKDQLARDAMREQLKQIGLIDKDHNLTLADGSTYDIGLDGKHRYQNVDGTERAPYEVDLNNPLSHEAIGWAQPIAALLTGGEEKARTWLTGYLVNAAQSNANGDPAKVLENLQAIFLSLGASPEETCSALSSQNKQGNISDALFAAYKWGLECLFNGTDSKGTNLLGNELQNTPNVTLQEQPQAYFKYDQNYMAQTPTMYS